METEIEFRNERQRLMNALMDSIERGRLLHQQLRGLKESIVTSALKVYLTNRITDEDGMSIESLREQAVQSKTRYLEAEKRAKSAAEIVHELTVEINILKKAVTVPNSGNKNALQTATGNGTDRGDMQRDDIDINLAMPKVLASGGTDTFRIGALNCAGRRPSSSPSSRKHNGSQDQRGREGDVFDWNQDVGARSTFNESATYDRQRHQRPTSSSIASSRPSDSGSADHEQEIADSFTNFHLLQRPVRGTKEAVAAKNAILSSTLPTMGTGWAVRPLSTLDASKIKLRASNIKSPASTGSSPGGILKQGRTLR